MNYRNTYMIIINKAKSENRKKGNGIYYEQHHILPKSLFPLWKNLNHHKFNKVLLTDREHYFCHQLLEKIYPGNKMFLALWRLANDGQNKYCSSKEYERLKIKYHKISFSEETRLKMRIAKLGHIQSKEQREKRSKSLKERWLITPKKKNSTPVWNKGLDYHKLYTDEERKKKFGVLGKTSWLKGKHLPEYLKKKISKKLKGSIPWNKGLVKPEQTSGENHWLYGKHHSKETKDKISASKKGVKVEKHMGFNHPTSIAVKCITTNKIFGSMKQALEEYKLKSKGIKNACLTGKSFGIHPDTKENLFWEFYNGKN